MFLHLKDFQKDPSLDRSSSSWILATLLLGKPSLSCLSPLSLLWLFYRPHSGGQTNALPAPPLKHNQPVDVRLRELLTFPGPPSSSPNMFIQIPVQNAKVLFLEFLNKSLEKKKNVKHVCNCCFHHS
ncbi:hypothetical protein XENORESO_002496 [Xenotaenia resolanae]|uniref:Uncharacterized protein n=1 Tax=Xenotaenia resolanae TaxID=208358 RepID=A0ABV0WKD0_9TELE